MKIVAVEKDRIVLDSGEELIVRYEKLRTLCEQLQQEGDDVTVKTWWTPKGTELIEIHRANSRPKRSEPAPGVF